MILFSGSDEFEKSSKTFSLCLWQVNQFTLTNLHPGRRYRVKLAPLMNNGKLRGAYSSWVNARTLEGDKLKNIYFFSYQTMNSDWLKWITVLSCPTELRCPIKNSPYFIVDVGQKSSETTFSLRNSSQHRFVLMLTYHNRQCYCKNYKVFSKILDFLESGLLFL